MKLETPEETYLYELGSALKLAEESEELLTFLAKHSDMAGVQELFAGHADETHEHRDHLIRAFELSERKPENEQCPAIDGIRKEGEKLIDHLDDPTLRDLGVLITASKLEHYEISVYRSLIALCQMLGKDESARLLQKNLGEAQRASDEIERMLQRLTHEMSSWVHP